MSFLMSSSHLFFGLPSGRVNIGFHMFTFFTILSSGICCKWLNQLNLCALMWFIIFLCLINSSNSSFVLILCVLSPSFVGPKIFLNTFFSNTISLICTVPFKIRFTSVCYYCSYTTPVQFQFWFLGDQSTFKEKLVSIIARSHTPKKLHKKPHWWMYWSKEVRIKSSNLVGDHYSLMTRRLTINYT